MIDQNIFKTALSKMPTGVTVISTVYNAELFGFTSNSFASVSLYPPLISFCLEKSARSMIAFEKADNFAVSILSEKQEDISRHFAAHIDHKFEAAPHHPSEHLNLPLIKQSLCWLECKKINVYEGGDHLMFVGEVINTIMGEEQNPLLYFEKKYRSIK